MRRPTWKQLDSSSLDKVWYNRINKDLHIIFNSGHYYIYSNVSYYRYWMLRKADSVGRYFYFNIRSQYLYRRIE